MALSAQEIMMLSSVSIEEIESDLQEAQEILGRNRSRLKELIDDTEFDHANIRIVFETVCITAFTIEKLKQFIQHKKAIAN